MDQVGRHEDHITRLERVAGIAHHIVRIAGNEKIQLIKFMVVRRDLVVGLVYGVLGLEITLDHKMLVQPVIFLI